MITVLFTSVSENVTAQNDDYGSITCDDIKILFKNTVDLSDTNTTEIFFKNNARDKATVYLSVSPQKEGHVHASINKGSFIINPNEVEHIIVTFDVDKTPRCETCAMDIAVRVLNYDSNKFCTENIQYNVKLTSEYSSNGPYNKVLGLVNPLPESLKTAGIASTITVIIWMAASFIAYKILFVIFRIVNKSGSSNKMSRRDCILFTIPVITYGFVNVLEVYGIEGTTIIWLRRIFSFLDIPLIAFIVWRVYKNAVSTIFNKMKLQNKIVDADTFLIPLFNMIGKIIISVCAISVMLNTFGYDLVAIVTGAGIAGMAISIGAQNVFTEFFSGINIRTTRLFKHGDIVKIGTKNDIYEVEEIGLMNCRFKNWINLERVIIPNSSVFSNFVVNITEEASAYRIFLYYTVAYDSDLKKVRQILMDSAYKHPEVITDSDAKPDVKLTKFKDSAIEYCLTVHVTNFKDHIRISDDLNESIYKNLCESGIEIPYNKLDIYVKRREVNS